MLAIVRHQRVAVDLTLVGERAKPRGIEDQHRRRPIGQRLAHLDDGRRIASIGIRERGHHPRFGVQRGRHAVVDHVQHTTAVDERTRPDERREPVLVPRPWHQRLHLAAIGRRILEVGLDDVRVARDDLALPVDGRVVEPTWPRDAHLGQVRGHRRDGHLDPRPVDQRHDTRRAVVDIQEASAIGGQRDIDVQRADRREPTRLGAGLHREQRATFSGRDGDHRDPERLRAREQAHPPAGQAIACGARRSERLPRQAWREEPKRLSRRAQDHDRVGLRRQQLCEHECDDEHRRPNARSPRRHHQRRVKLALRPQSTKRIAFVSTQR